MVEVALPPHPEFFISDFAIPVRIHRRELLVQLFRAHDEAESSTQHPGRLLHLRSVEEAGAVLVERVEDLPRRHILALVVCLERLAHGLQQGARSDRGTHCRQRLGRLVRVAEVALPDPPLQAERSCQNKRKKRLF